LQPFADEGLLPAFPLGTDLDETEQRLAALLQSLQSSGPTTLARLALLGAMRSTPGVEPLLTRMGLEKPRSFSEWLYRSLLRGALSGKINSP
jgi:hypothetical protein